MMQPARHLSRMVLLLALTIGPAVARPQHPAPARQARPSATCAPAQAGFILRTHPRSLRRLGGDGRYAPVGQAMFYPEGHRCRIRTRHRWHG